MRSSIVPCAFAAQPRGRVKSAEEGFQTSQLTCRTRTLQVRARLERRCSRWFDLDLAASARGRGSTTGDNSTPLSVRVENRFPDYLGYHGAVGKPGRWPVQVVTGGQRPPNCRVSRRGFNSFRLHTVSHSQNLSHSGAELSPIVIILHSAIRGLRDANT